MKKLCLLIALSTTSAWAGDAMYVCGGAVFSDCPCGADAIEAPMPYSIPPGSTEDSSYGEQIHDLEASRMITPWEAKALINELRR
jgi:hypothetical protein